MDAVPVADPTNQRAAVARPTEDIISPVYSKGTTLARNRLIEVSAGHLVALDA